MRLADGSLPSAAALARGRATIDTFLPRAERAADGSFSFTGLEPRPHRLWLDVPGFEELETRVDVAAGPTSQVELVLSPGVTVSGRVLDEGGAPLPRALVWVSSAVEDDGNTCYGPSEVDALGGFSFDCLPAGAIEVGALCDGFHEAKMILGAMPAGASRDGVELVLAEGNRVAGYVVQPLDLSNEDVQLQLFDETEKSEHDTKPDDAGHFVFTGLGPGPFRVWAWNAEEYEPLHAVGALAHVAPNTLDLEILMEAPGSVELAIGGRVSAREARVLVVDVDGRGENCPSDQLVERPSVRVDYTEEGVTIADVWPGEYGIVITDDALDETRVALLRIVVHPGETIQAAVVLEPACSLDVWVWMDGRLTHRGSTLARSDDGFCLRFSDGDHCSTGGAGSRMGSLSSSTWLPPGNYAIEAECDGKRAAGEVVLSLGDESEITLELE